VQNPIDDCVGFRVAAAHRRLDRVFNREYEGIGLSHTHAQILVCLFERGPSRMTDIAALTGLSHSTVSRLTKELSRHRYLRRKPDPTDGRAQLLSAGNRAVGLKDELYRIHALVNARVRREIADADIAHLFEILSLIEPHG